MAKRVVIDANIALALFLKLPYSVSVDRQMQAWGEEEARLIVPGLWEYECVSGLRRAAVLKLISPQDAHRILADLLALELERIAPTQELHRLALHWSELTGQSKVYDGYYLALADQLSAEFWTADRRLFHTLQEIEIAWAHSFE